MKYCHNHILPCKNNNMHLEQEKHSNQSAQWNFYLGMKIICYDLMASMLKQPAFEATCVWSDVYTVSHGPWGVSQDKYRITESHCSNVSSIWKGARFLSFPQKFLSVTATSSINIFYQVCFFPWEMEKKLLTEPLHYLSLQVWAAWAICKDKNRQSKRKTIFNPLTTTLFFSFFLSSFVAVVVVLVASLIGILLL